jgi:hypothetical protein
VRLHFLRHDDIDRQQNLALALRRFQNLARRIGHVLLSQRPANLDALRIEEGVRHAAADSELVELRDQILQQLQLRRNLGPADNPQHRPLRRPQRRLKRIQLPLHLLAGIRSEVMRNAFSARVRTV